MEFVGGSHFASKHAFISWLAVRNRLTTKEKLAQWGYQGNLLFVYCRSRVGLSLRTIYFLVLYH